MRNTLTDLNNHLFAQMERLSDEDVTGEKLLEEINRAKAVSEIAKTIVTNGNLMLEAHDRFGPLGAGKKEKDPKALSKLFLPEP